MLRKALDEANLSQQQQHQQQHHHEAGLDGDNLGLQDSSETDHLLGPPQQQHQHHQQQGHHHHHHHHHQSYAATNAEEQYGVGDVSNSYDEEDEDDDEDDDDDEEAYVLGKWHDPRTADGGDDPPSSILARIWKGLKQCFFLVANVENLWDSPDVSSAEGPIEVPRRNHYIVLFWFFILASMYAAERTTFYLLAHRTAPFRLFAVEMVTATHAILVGLGMLISAISRKDFQMQPLGIPIVDVGLMALLDTFNLLLVYLTGLHVPPTLTVILVQFTLPFTAFLTQFVHNDGCARSGCDRDRPSTRNNDSPDTRSSDGRLPESNPGIIEGSPLGGCGGLCMEHVLGSAVIALAVLLALCPAIYSIVDPDFFVYADPIPMQTAYNTLLYVSSCIPAAASQLYKEHIFLHYKQPVQADHLNLILSVFQLIFASIVSPLVYSLQGLGARDDTALYSSKEFSKNFFDGFRCFLGTLDEETASHGYADSAECNYSFAFVLLNSFSIISVGVAVDKIINAGATKVMSRGVSAGIILSVICLYNYDLHIPEFNYGPAVDSLNLICLILLVVGSEIYHRVGLQDATFQTVFPEVENFYDDVE